MQRTEDELGDVSPERLVNFFDASREEQSWAHFKRTGLYEEGGEDTVDLFASSTPQENLEKFKRWARKNLPGLSFLALLLPVS